MKTAIFTWLFLLPLQIYSNSYHSELPQKTLPLAFQIEANSTGQEIKNSESRKNFELQEANSNFSAIID